MLGKQGWLPHKASPWGLRATCSSKCEQRLPAWSGVCSAYETHMNAPRWRQLGALPMPERGPHPGFSNHPGPNFRKFPDPLPTVPDAPEPLIHFSHVLAFPCLAPSPSLLSNM